MIVSERLFGFSERNPTIISNVQINGDILSSTVVGLGSDTTKAQNKSNSITRSQNLVFNAYSCSIECGKNYAACIKASTISKSQRDCDVLRDCRRFQCSKENWNQESEQYKEKKVQCWTAARNNFGKQAHQKSLLNSIEQ